MTILIIAEHDNKVLNKTTQHVITAAQQLKQEIHVLVAGFNCNPVAESAKKLESIAQVIHADNSAYQNMLAENFAALISSLAKNYDYVMAPATTFGKNILPRVAGLLDVGQISDVVAIVSADTFVRPIYAGNALATVQSLDKIKILTTRTTAFSACKLNNTTCNIQTISTHYDLKLSTYLGCEATANSKLPDLTSAQIVIAGGRGLQSKENFALIEQLAILLHAAIGASRAAVDAGFVPNDYQVGQTGKIVAPELYIAIGISGAIQHIAGMKDSKVIVAINKDPDAPIFSVADYGIVGDLFIVVPELIAAISTDARFKSSV